MQTIKKVCLGDTIEIGNDIRVELIASGSGLALKIDAQSTLLISRKKTKKVRKTKPYILKVAQSHESGSFNAIIAAMDATVTSSKDRENEK